MLECFLGYGTHWSDSGGSSDFVRVFSYFAIVFVSYFAIVFASGF